MIIKTKLILKYMEIRHTLKDELISSNHFSDENIRELYYNALKKASITFKLMSDDLRKLMDKLVYELGEFHAHSNIIRKNHSTIIAGGVATYPIKSTNYVVEEIRNIMNTFSIFSDDFISKLKLNIEKTEEALIFS